MAVIVTFPPSSMIVAHAIQVMDDILNTNGLTLGVFLLNTKNPFPDAETKEIMPVNEAKIDINDYGFSSIYRINARNSSDRPLLDTQYEHYEVPDNLSEIIEVTNQLGIELASAFAFP